jgi:transposase
MPVRIVEDAPRKEAPRQLQSARRPAERAGKSAAVIEVVLRNGRVLRVFEAIMPEMLGRLAAALDR